MAFKYHPIQRKEIGTSLSEMEGLTMTITQDRYIHIGESPINIFLLENKLKEYFYGREKKVVFIRADESLPYGYVINVLDVTKKAGVQVVGLVVKPIEERERR
jgi:biopolymer transport protein TolR